MESLHFENLHCIEAHVFNVSRQKALQLILTFALKVQPIGRAWEKNERGLLRIFSKMLPLSCVEHVEYALW